MRIGIIGAGLAGAFLGDQLSKLGHEIRVYEKSRGVGGRLATRRGDDVQFDHGAPYITARTEPFQSLLQAHGLSVAVWAPKVTTLAPQKKRYKRDWFEPHFVGTPKMGALCASLLKNCDVRFQREVTQVVSVGSGTRMDFKDDTSEEFDWVISTAPAEQTAALLNIELNSVRYDPSFALFGRVDDIQGFDAAVVKESPIGWVELTHRKPGRASAPVMVAQSDRAWARQHFDSPLEQVTADLTAALDEVGLNFLGSPSIHRWRYAHVVKPHPTPYWIHSSQRMAGCGDWGLGANAEDAFRSAFMLLEELVRRGV